MSHSPLVPLEVTRAILNCARGAQFHFGEETALVAVQHMLLQTVDLFRMAGAIGINFKNIFALGKVYSNSLPVIQILRDMGVTVIESTMPEPGEFRSYFRRDVERLWQVASETLRQRNIRRILVLDDGGVGITNVPAEVLQRYSVCGVEQTSQGMFLFEEHPPPFAVISWARSAVKLQIGGPIFSQSFIEKLNTEYLRGQSIAGANVGIIGLGTIGRAAAKLAARQGAKVLFYDPNVYVPKSLQQTIRRTNSVEELMVSCEYVVGCSGRKPFKQQWPVRHRPGIKLFSASGGDHEFGPIIKDLTARPDFEVNPDGWTITSKHGPSGPIEIAYRGYPYNFVSRAPEAVPTQIVQIETGGLLAALVQARIYLQVCEANPKNSKRLHRVAAAAQSFVYQTWLKAMKELGINLTEVFGYDAETLNQAQADEWIIKNTDLPASEFEDVMEELMTRFFSQRCAVRVQGER